MNALPQNLANMLAMTKRDSDAYSTHSMASRGSERRKSSSSRFSLRRMFRRSSTRSARLAKSASELETRSVSSLQTSGGGGDLALQSVSSEEGSTSTARGAVGGKQLMECPLCLAQQPEEQFPVIMTCHHRSCQECLRQYLRIEIMESRVNIACPECSEKFHPNDIKLILAEDELMSKYEEFMLRRVMVSEPDARWCPAPDCGYAVIATGCASCPKLKCERPGCDTHFCYHCKQHWHPNQTCDAARAERAAHLRSSSISYSHESSAQKIKPCPRCGAFIIKMDDGSCNHMTCAVCGAEFCWLCMKEISDLHYLSPSGCTFWGKKPWSRKKKILWQLGTLVGAPVGISLLASIAVPAMVIGIPIWVGRKLHTKYQYAPKHKRNLVITGGVSASILISPILAGFAVGIGVPILLAYVYGVVPISLCRSGGCGVTTTNKGGVRFEFDDDNDVTVGVSGPYTGTPGDAHSVETTSHHVTNPSIGPSIGEMSVGMTNSLSASGSHMDRVGVIRDESDRDSASNRAIAGASLNGSLCGSAVAGPSGFQNRLEVHADITTNPSVQKRNSLSSESATVSLDAKSATVSFGDDASTKALAGSICNSRSRHESGSSSQAPEGAAANRAGSPTSGRSVNFEDCYIVGHGSRSKRYKRHSLSVGDRIHEHAEVSPERLSVRSLTTDEGMMQMAVAQVDVNANNNKPMLPWLQEVTGSQSTHSSASFDSTSSSQQGATGGLPRSHLPEVDNDRPVTYIVHSLVSDHRSSGESSTDTGLTATSTDRLHKCDSRSESSMSEDGDHGHVNETDSFSMKKRLGSPFS